MIKTGGADDLSSIEWAIDNRGHVEVLGGKLELQAFVTGDGEFHATSGVLGYGSDVLVSGDWYVDDGGALLIDSDELASIGPSASLNLDGDAVFRRSGDFAGQARILSNAGLLSLTGGARKFATEEQAMVHNTGEIAVDAASEFATHVDNRGTVSGSGHFVSVALKNGIIHSDGGLRITSVLGDLQDSSFDWLPPGQSVLRGDVTAGSVDLFDEGLTLQSGAKLSTTSFLAGLKTDSQPSLIAIQDGATLETGSLIVGNLSTVSVDAGGSLVSTGTTPMEFSGGLIVDGAITGDVLAFGSGANKEVSGVGQIDGNLGVNTGVTIVSEDTLNVTGSLLLGGTVDRGTVAVGEVTVADLGRVAEGAVLSTDVQVVENGGGLTVDGVVTGGVFVDRNSRLSGSGTIGGDVVLNHAALEQSDVGMNLQSQLVTRGSSRIQNAIVDVDALTTIETGTLTVGSNASLIGEGAINIQDGSLVVAGTVQKDLFIGGRAVLEGEINGDTTLGSGADVSSTAGFGLVGNCFGTGDATVNSPEITLNDIFAQSGTLQIDTNSFDANSVSISSNAEILFNGNDPDLVNIQVGTVRLDGALAGQWPGPDVPAVNTNKIRGGGFTAMDYVVLGATAYAQANQPGLGDVVGGLISPGSSPGTLTFAGTASDTLSIELMPESAPVWLEGEKMPGLIDFEIADASGVMGIDWDLIDVTQGGVALSGDSGNVFSVNLISLADFENEGALKNFDPSQNYSWRFMDTELGFSGLAFDDIVFSVDESQFATFHTYDGTFQITADSSTSLAIQYTAAAVPEPASVMLLFALTAVLVRRNRSRKAAAPTY